jgi:hypothetical protein
MRCARRRSSLKLLNTLVEVIGVVFIALGLGLGVADGDTLGGMVGLVVGVSVIVMGAWTLPSSS